MAAGQGFKTFTTGEVLTAGDVNGYLMQGINVFASSAARAAAITSPQEGQYSFLKDTNALEYYDGAAWVGAPVGDITAVTAGKGLTGGGSSGDVTVALATTAKGDLVAGSGASTAAVLTVGSNDTVLTADSSTATGLKWATPSAGSSNVAGKNAILNSNFEIWQRGTSVASTGGNGVYTADRWSCYRVTYTVSQQATNDTTNLPFINKCARVQRDSGSSTTAGVNFVQPLESVNSKPFIGKVATLSFYARAGANYSSASNALLVYLLGGTGTDQNPNNTYTGQSSVIAQTATLTSTWQRFSYTSSAIATTVNELAVQFTSIGVGTAGAADYFEVTGVQLEIASSASAYSPNTSTYQAELAACQRYYWRFTAAAGGANYLCLGRTTTQVDVEIQHPVQMRTSPAALEYGGTTDISDINVAGYNTTSLAFANASVLFASIRANIGQASLAQGKTYVFGVQTNAYYGFSAEL